MCLGDSFCCNFVELISHQAVSDISEKMLTKPRSQVSDKKNCAFEIDSGETAITRTLFF